MILINSVSGGMTSAYMAANHSADLDIFALVRTSDKNCIYPDKKLRRVVEDKIQKPFIGTLEEDEIIHTILDLEQFIGREIKWVSGITYDELLDLKGGYLPNKRFGFCTTYLKLFPIIEYTYPNFGAVNMNIGYRADNVDMNRAENMLKKCNSDGLIEMKYSFKKHESGQHKGKNKWENLAWQKPLFPLIKDNINKRIINLFWKGKKIRFAQDNNCVGCYNRNPLFLRFKAEKFPNKFKWFVDRENESKGFWQDGVKYSSIETWPMQLDLFREGFSGCDSGFCNV